MRTHIFAEGDIIYKKSSENTFYPYKILKIEIDPDGSKVWHLLNYNVVDHEPKIEDLRNFSILILHTPIEAFEDKAVYLTNEKVTEDELMGYKIYLQQTNQA